MKAQTGKLFISEKGTDSSFPLATAATIANMYYDAADAGVVKIAAEAFSKDLQLVTGKEMPVSANVNPGGDYILLTGTIGHSSLIDGLILTNTINVSAIRDKWESFGIFVIDQPFSLVKKALVIAGSDRRGTAYGIFHLSRLIGVSPFVWWADIVPAKRQEIFISGSYISSPPSVKYRGIFINDEDWGLQPWAAKNMDKDIKDIGPKTYAKVFELLLRLKANYIWPAMHPCTKAFYYYKDNPKVADDYAIIVGGSHCEPMLRNNVFEWAENFEHEYGKKPGEWRYDVNKEEIYKYWDDRVKEAVHYESVYTVGMRGIHDGSMPGPKDPDEKKKLLENVINDQRKILGLDLNKPVEQVPQIFIPYKEVLSLYRRGLKLDDDITIIWPDDNYGYIRQLPDEQERKRSGGHGIYYHLSYWGSPQDYLWLCSTSPSLISYEMTKAYDYGADRLWVFNVGDIKPAELELQFAMDLAWDIRAWTPGKAFTYTKAWAKEIFGEKTADDIAAIKNEYYLLAQSGKPEHINSLDFSLPDARQRIDRYAALYTKALSTGSSIPPALKDAYYELILYPVLSAGLMNRKVLLARQSFGLPGYENQKGAYDPGKAMVAFDSIRLITDIYNKQIAGGKWDGIMSWHPRDQPAFKKPLIKDSVTAGKADSLRKIYFRTPVPQLIIEASACTAKKENTVTGLIAVKGLGINGEGITRFAKPGKRDNDSGAIYADYFFSLSEGEYTVIVKCLPDFDVNTSKNLRYGVAINDETPQTVNVYAEADSKEWKENVLRGYSSGKTIHKIQQNTQHKLRLWFKDPNLVINTIEFYKQ
ncbi:MAG: glycosyl hydrolase 115 family protein [Bacteroidota bacterium]|nr:glycosyl hydrolase 115 family protein [Bacteroidota bacterium]